MRDISSLAPIAPIVLVFTCLRWQKQCTLLHIAVEYNRENLIEPLLDKGALVNARDEVRKALPHIPTTSSHHLCSATPTDAHFLPPVSIFCDMMCCAKNCGALCPVSSTAELPCGTHSTCLSVAIFALSFPSCSSMGPTPTYRTRYCMAINSLRRLCMYVCICVCIYMCVCVCVCV